MNDASGARQAALRILCWRGPGHARVSRWWHGARLSEQTNLEGAVVIEGALNGAQPTHQAETECLVPPPVSQVGIGRAALGWTLGACWARFPSHPRTRPSVLELSPWWKSGCIRPALHPVSTPTRLPRWGPRLRLRCSSFKYSRYSRSSRLAGRAHHRPRCRAGLSPRTASGGFGSRRDRRCAGPHADRE